MKQILIFLLLFCPFLFLATSCGDDTPNGEDLTWNSYLDGKYSPDNETNLLSATVNGVDVNKDASVTFRAGDLQKGSMTLDNLFDGYGSIEIKDVVMKKEDEDPVRLTFTGTKKISDTFSLSYSGYVIWGHLYIELTTD